MAHEISFEKAQEKARQAEIIFRMIESYPDHMSESEITDPASLLRCLTGDVAAWLIEEQAARESQQ